MPATIGSWLLQAELTVRFELTGENANRIVAGRQAAISRLFCSIQPTKLATVSAPKGLRPQAQSCPYESRWGDWDGAGRFRFTL